MLIFCMIKDIHTKFEANQCIGLRKEVKNVIFHSDIYYYTVNMNVP